MSKFKPTVISDEFINAITDAQINNKSINFKTSIGSSSVLTDEQTAANSYDNSQKLSKDVTGVIFGYNNTDTNTLTISVEINNTNLSNDTKVSTLLLFAEYNSKNILVATARLNDPELLPAYNGTPVTLEFELYLKLERTDNITLQFNNAGLVTRQEGARIDASAVHITGNETINGTKEFLQKIKGTIENADTSGLAAKATQLATSRKIGGSSFDGTKDIDLPGVNIKGNQDTSGLAAKATQLANNRTIKLKGLVNGSGTFDGTQDLTITTDPTITENNLNADLSTFNLAGNFYVYGALKNSPIDNGYGLLQVFKMSGGIVHLFTDLQTGKTYSRTNISSKGYGNWILNADDSTVVHNSGSQSIAGSITIPIENSMVLVGVDKDIAMVKKQGQGGTLVVGNGKTFKLQKSNQSQINPTDEMTDLMTVDQSGNIKAKSFYGIIQPRISPVTDMNLIIDSGVYKVPNSFTNLPSGVANGGILEVYTYDDNVTYQILYVQTSKIWKRYKFGATWYSWNLLADDSSVVHNSGDETLDGIKTFKRDVKVGNSSYGQGLIELSGSLPYIDFHFGNSTSDFTSRIIENTSGQLSFVNASGLQTIKANIDGTAAKATAPSVQGIPTNTDLNNLTTAGFYSFQQGSVVNSPVATYFSLNVITVGTYNGTQVLVDANTGVVWTRSWFSGSKWSDWKNGSDTNVNKILPTDANNVTKSGIYVFNGSNLPSANDYYVFVTKFDDSKVKQVAMRDYDNATFIRTKTGGTWYDWLPLSTTTPIEMNDDYHVDGLKTAGQYTNKSGKMKGLPAYPVWGFLEVMNNGVDIIQRFNITSGDDSHTFYQRAYASGSWTAWKAF